MNNTQIQNIANDIFNIFIDEYSTFRDLHNKFYEVMRKYNIKQNTLDNETNSLKWAKTTPEWDICYTYFLAQITEAFNLKDSFTNPPDDLKY